jgi:hypothetical protein
MLHNTGEKMSDEERERHIHDCSRFMKQRAVIIISQSGRYISGGRNSDEAWRRLGGFLWSARTIRKKYKNLGYRCITVWWKE